MVGRSAYKNPRELAAMSAEIFGHELADLQQIAEEDELLCQNSRAKRGAPAQHYPAYAGSVYRPERAR